MGHRVTDQAGNLTPQATVLQQGVVTIASQVCETQCRASNEIEYAIAMQVQGQPSAMHTLATRESWQSKRRKCCIAIEEDALQAIKIGERQNDDHATQSGRCRQDEMCVSINTQQCTVFTSY